MLNDIVPSWDSCISGVGGRILDEVSPLPPVVSVGYWLVRFSAVSSVLILHCNDWAFGLVMTVMNIDVLRWGVAESVMSMVAVIVFRSDGTWSLTINTWAGAWFVLLPSLR